MIKSLIDSKVSSNFIVILDTENEKGQDIFISFLKSYSENTSYKSIDLLCLEQPPEFYLKNLTTPSNIEIHNFFKDPRAWVEPSSSKPDLNSILSNSTESVVFIDSLTYLIKYFGYYSTYKQLSSMKSLTKKIIILGHVDVINENQLEELRLLSSAIVKLKDCESKERLADVFYKKSGGKVINQEEIVSVSPRFELTSVMKNGEKSTKIVTDEEDMESLTTFKLGVNMSESERRARDELVLPYVRSGGEGGQGNIIYVQEAHDDLEDDPDDDLDI